MSAPVLDMEEALSSEICLEKGTCQKHKKTEIFYAGLRCFPAGGDTKFGLKCDAVSMWCFAVPLGYLAAFVWKLPVLTVYFVLNLDELVKLPVVFKHYRQYKWLKNLTEMGT